MTHEAFQGLRLESKAHWANLVVKTRWQDQGKSSSEAEAKEEENM